jgi:hypothetical protein
MRRGGLIAFRRLPRQQCSRPLTTKIYYCIFYCGIYRTYLSIIFCTWCCTSALRIIRGISPRAYARIPSNRTKSSSVNVSLIFFFLFFPLFKKIKMLFFTFVFPYTDKHSFFLCSVVWLLDLFRISTGSCFDWSALVPHWSLAAQCILVLSFHGFHHLCLSM